MSKKEKVLVDYIEPLEEEFLFGWIIRLLRYYSLKWKLDNNSYIDMQRLFGETVSFPGLYFQNGLKYFLDNFDLGNSKILSSLESILDNMTVLPFYTAFMEKDVVEVICKKFEDSLVYRNYEDLISLRQNHIYIYRIKTTYKSMVME